MSSKVKKIRKHLYNCIFCGEKTKEILDIHRIQEGCKGGKYTFGNTVTACANCHRKVHHTNEIEIEGWFLTLNGYRLCCKINGEEKALKP